MALCVWVVTSSEEGPESLGGHLKASSGVQRTWITHPYDHHVGLR